MEHNEASKRAPNIGTFIAVLYDRCTGISPMPAKPVYERKSFRMTDGVVNAAVSYAQSEYIAGKLAEWRDIKTVGLTLRITPGSAIWYVRRREITVCTENLIRVDDVMESPKLAE